MITGSVTAEREAVVDIVVRAPGGQPETVTTGIDTGFTECLALPREQIARLGLPFRGSQQATLADGSEIGVPVYRALAEWHGRPARVLVLGVEGGALLGMGLLHGSRLTPGVVDSGAVAIRPPATA